MANTSGYGRIKLYTNRVINGNIENDKQNIPLIINDVINQHNTNVGKYNLNKNWYYNNTDAILSKTKYMRPEIDNKFSFSIARTTVNMNNGYCFGVPFKYITNETDEKKIQQVGEFNKCLNAVNAHKHTLKATKSSGIYGISYKLATKPTPEQLEQGIYFNIISDIDNSSAFKVYSKTLDKSEVISVVYHIRDKYDEKGIKKGSETVYTVWTDWHQWEFVKNGNEYTNSIFPVTIGNTALDLEAFPLKIDAEARAIRTKNPMQEFERTDDRVGDFELSIKLIDAINTLACCRLDSVQQSTDYIIKLRDIDVGTFDDEGKNEVLDRIQEYLRNHILAVESIQGATVQPDIDILDIPLNQSEVQQLQNFLEKMLMEELQQPTRDGGTGQDTGVAVENRNGFRQLENNAVTITNFAISAEKEFVARLLSIAKEYPDCPFKDLQPKDIEIQSMRNRSENLTNSTTNYREMRNAGVNPYTAYATSGLVADINDTVALDNKWREQEIDFVISQKSKLAEELTKIKMQYGEVETSVTDVDITDEDIVS